MNETKVAHSRRRNTKGAASSKKFHAKRRAPSPDRSLRSSSAKTRDNFLGLPSDKRHLDHAARRYADLYDFAPTGYVSFDRSGRIEEINLTAAQLFGMPRERLIGMPFMVFVARGDTELFLHHLLRCRCSDTRVESELQLKDVKHKIIHAVLSSTPVLASVRNGALLYQTAIVDVTERKAAEAALQEK